MRVLMICVTYPPYNISGATRYFYDVSRKLAEKGINVEVITSQIDHEGIKKEGKIRIHRIKAMEFEDRTDMKGQAKALIDYLQKLVKKRKVDIISSQDLHGWPGYNPGYTLASNLISLDNNIPNVLTVHSFFCLQSENNPAIVPLRYLFWDKVIGVSGAISDKIHGLGVEIKKITTCYPGVDLNKFRPGLGKKWLRSRIDARENDKIVLFAGALSENKGLSDLLKSFSIVSQDKSDYKLLIAAARGNIKHKEEFEEAIKNTYEKAELLGIRGKVKIHPFEFEEMPLVYNGCDLFVLPSKTEAFGLVYAEAMACGLPVIGTGVGGIPEVITSGVEGYLVNPGEKIELAKKMGSLLKNPNKMVEMGKKGVKKVKQKFDLDKAIERLIGVYHSTFEKKTGKLESNEISGRLISSLGKK